MTKSYLGSGSHHNGIMASTKIQPRATPSAEISLQAKEFAAELQVNKCREPFALDALRYLARACVIRFGIPRHQESLLPTSLGIPTNSNLNYPPRGIEVDPRWERLSRALRLPAEGGLAIDGPLVIANQRERAALQGAIEGLVTDLKKAGELRAIDPSIANTLRAYIDKVREAVYDHKVVEHKDSRPESYKALVQAFRQLALYFKDGPQWALVSEKEHQILQAFAEEVRNVSAKDRLSYLNDKDTQPNGSLLSHLSMNWVWDNKLQQWGPQLPNTRYKNSSLFRLSATALEASMKNSLAPKAYSFLEALKAAREEFESGGDKISLKQAQVEAFRKALNKNN